MLAPAGTSHVQHLHQVQAGTCPRDFSSFSPWTRQTEQQPVHPSIHQHQFLSIPCLAVPLPPTILLCVLLTYAYISKFPSGLPRRDTEGRPATAVTARNSSTRGLVLGGAIWLSPQRNARRKLASWLLLDETHSNLGEQKVAPPPVLLVCWHVFFPGPWRRGIGQTRRADRARAVVDVRVMSCIRDQEEKAKRDDTTDLARRTGGGPGRTYQRGGRCIWDAAPGSGLRDEEGKKSPITSCLAGTLVNP